MNTPRKVFLAFLAMALILTGCGDDDDVPEPVSYTTLIYIAADNSLDTEVDYTLEQLKAGAKSSDGTPVVYLDRKSETPRLFKISSAGEEIPLRSYAEENSASAATLRRVIDETKALEPSEQFGLVLWSHSMGWVPSGFSNQTLAATYKTAKTSFPRTRYIGIDDHPGEGSSSTQVMEITDIAEQLSAGTAEFILFDVCLMGSVEALYELRHTCNYMVASPAEVLAEADYNASGMPYSEVLPLLFGGKEELIKVCQRYYNHYNGKSGLLQSATVSLIDSRELDVLYNVASGILNGKLSQMGTLNVNGLQVYHTSNVPQVFFDLGDVMQQVSTKAQYADFEEQMNRTVISKAATEKFAGEVTIDPEHFSGLSVYVPLAKWKGNTEYNYYFTLEWSSVY